MINTVLFDLDGTLLPIKMKDFEKIYYRSITEKFSDIISPEKFLYMMNESLKTMIVNTEKITNENVFMDKLKTYISEDEFDVYQERFMHFYENEFSVLQQAVKPNKDIQQAVSILKEKGYDCMVATNPMFPKLAITKRIEWAGFSRDDFSYVTSFEENHYCKPQIDYYKEVLALNNKEANECLMVGNDELEDLIASTIGIKTYFITDYALYRENGLQADHKGDYQSFLAYVEAMPSLK
jgi:FMN phosphatase YigB (HAD superfamily)